VSFSGNQSSSFAH